MKYPEFVVCARAELGPRTDCAAYPEATATITVARASSVAAPAGLDTTCVRLAQTGVGLSRPVRAPAARNAGWWRGSRCRVGHSPTGRSGVPCQLESTTSALETVPASVSNS